MKVVLSGETRYDDYSNFWFKDKEGKERKIGTKREDFEELCTRVENNPNRAVTLKFDHYMNKPYIVGVELLDKQIQVDEAEITKQQVTPATPKPSIAPQELGMWWKELGNRIGDGSIDRDFPKSAVWIKGQYYKQMEAVTGISMKKED